jgi:hypothetical protein
VVSLRMADGGEASFPLRQVQGRQVVAAVPWRKTRSARGQAHYPGYFWSATTGGHVIYESRLELARLLLADFDRSVTAIAAQPFLLQARVAGTARRHVPDFLLVHADKSVTVVSVKPARKLADPQTAEALAWPGRLIEDHGWQYELWSGPTRCCWRTCASWPATGGPACCRKNCWTRFSPRSGPATRSAA